MLNHLCLFTVFTFARFPLFAARPVNTSVRFLKMQPYTNKGRRTRLLLMPISWIFAFVTLYFILVILSKIDGAPIKGLLQTDTLWPLAVFFPGFFFGKILGLMFVNILAYLTPPIRQIFESEVDETGRHSLSKAMSDLGKALILSGMVTVMGAFIFLKFK